MINIIEDDTILDDVFGKKIIDVLLVPMGINNSMYNGFRHEVSVTFPSTKEADERTNYCDPRKLGSVVFVNYPWITICLCYISNGSYHKNSNDVFVDYKAVENCLKIIDEKFNGKKIASPILGCDKYDGNGNKVLLTKIFFDQFKNNEVYLYDFEQEDFDTVIYNKIRSLCKRLRNKEISYQEYTDERKKLSWIRKNGRFKPYVEK